MNRALKLIGLGFLIAAICGIMSAQETTTSGPKAQSQDTSSSTKTTSSDTSNDKDQADIVKRMNSAADVFSEIMQASDKGIPQDILNSAECVGIVPSMIKGGFGFGGRYGKGVATCRTSNGWSAPAPITIAGGSWGLQIGGEAVDLVMLVMNDKGMQHLLSSKFKIGGEASAAAGPIGRQTEANTDWKMRAEILTYSRARGIFAGLELNGAVVKQDKDSTRILYGGKLIDFKTLLKGAVPPPASAQHFLATVRKYAAEAKEERGSLSTPKSNSARAGASR